ncbi:MAG: EamA family transporter [Clostridia bacterium]|nr:EamA family transporter [Clostridia bacterium]
MGYFYLVLSVFMSVTKAFCSKKQSSKASTIPSALLTSFVRMLMCIPVGLVLLLAAKTEISALWDINMVLISLFCAVATSCYVIVWLFSVRRGAFMLSTVFVMLGVAVTVTLSGIFFGEPITLKDIISFLILVAASLVMCSYNKEINGKLDFLSVVLLILCGLLNGLMDFSQKLFVYNCHGGSAEGFNFYTYLFSSIILGIAFLFFNKSEYRGEENPKSVLKSVFVFIALMGIATFLGSYFKTFSAKLLPSAVMYPLFQGLTLPLTTIMTAVFFKEKITVKSIIGIALAFLSVLIINI